MEPDNYNIGVYFWLHHMNYYIYTRITINLNK
jgi:hypothetical protein